MIERQKTSPLSEATLWNLYRRLLGEQLFSLGLPPGYRSRGPVPGAGAAVTENLLTGDTLGLAPGDLATRYLCCLPLEQLRNAAAPAKGRRKSGSWALAADAEHGLLPGAGEDQAGLAMGAALSARLHQTGSITMLFDGSAPRREMAANKSTPSAWAQAAQMAVTLKLPLLFITTAPPPPVAGSKRDAALLPAIPVDRSDALALYRVIYESAERARAGGGPTWIECLPWKLTGPGSKPSQKSASPNSVSQESALEKMEQALRSRKLFNSQQQRQVRQALEKEFARVGWPLHASDRFQSADR